MTVISGRILKSYIFKGKLETKTILHVGSGEGDDRTDACVVKVRRNDGTLCPVIPGSSLKGALRSHVERIASSLGIETCLLDASSGSSCLSVDKSLQKEVRDELEKGGSSGARWWYSS